MNEHSKMIFMIFISKLLHYLNRKHHHFVRQLESIYSKVEVITDSTAIVNSVRIMIVMLAFLMGYIHTPIDKNDFSEANKTEKIIQQDTVDFEDINK